MPTHKTSCVVCAKDCFCCDDTHALGIGGKSGEGGCLNPPYIEFCSLACAEELQRRIVEGISNYRFVTTRNPLDV